MAVVVREDTENSGKKDYYKMHKVRMPDASIFTYKETAPTGRGLETQNANQVTSPTVAVSNSNISDLTDDVNKNFSTKEDDNLRSWYYAVGRENIEYQKIITAMGDAGYSTIMSDVEVNPVDIDK